MDKKAKQILFQTYWSAKGWREKPVTAPIDFLYAKEKGMMFDPLTISHDDCVSQIVDQPMPYCLFGESCLCRDGSFRLPKVHHHLESLGLLIDGKVPSLHVFFQHGRNLFLLPHIRRDPAGKFRYPC